MQKKGGRWLMMLAATVIVMAAVKAEISRLEPSSGSQMTAQRPMSAVVDGTAQSKPSDSIVRVPSLFKFAPSDHAVLNLPFGRPSAGTKYEPRLKNASPPYRSLSFRTDVEPGFVASQGSASGLSRPSSSFRARIRSWFVHVRSRLFAYKRKSGGSHTLD